MRGEHIWLRCAAVVHEGSSPHARGTRRMLYLIRLPKGIIPACAGNTVGSSQDSLACRDHPRMRGEHSLSSSSMSFTSGSSPHARGTLLIHSESYTEKGIIPACAGNTVRIARSVVPARDHPRMRGEHLVTLPGAPEPPGSSPHARGTLIHLFRDVGEKGIIPACAGNTAHWMTVWCGYRDHPRMRGEHGPNTLAIMSHTGSSPHARGTP